MPKTKAKKKKTSGNYTVFDLGEKVDQAVRGLGGPQRSFRPGHLGREGNWWLGEKFKIPTTLSTKAIIAGGLLGVALNRSLERATPAILGVDKKLVVDAINFGIGIVPFAITQTSMTVGIALPGLFELGGSLVDMLLDVANVAKPRLTGSEPRKVADGRKKADALRRMADRPVAGTIRKAG